MQVLDNVKAANLKLTAEEMSKINELLSNLNLETNI